VRADHLRVVPHGVTPVQTLVGEGGLARIGGVPCTVREAEYQGTHLRMTLAPLDGSPELVSLVSDGDYDPARFGPESRVIVWWNERDAHPLAA
jgi:putative spermidine/putrescine transport system ATP-binding protein